MNRTLLMCAALLTLAGAAGAQPTPRARLRSVQERAVSDLIEHASRSREPAVALLAGMARLPDGIYERATIRKGIDGMEAFATMPRGSEAEFLALLDRWAAVDETLGKTKRIEKQGDRVRLVRDVAQELPFRDGELELAREITFRLRSGVHGPDLDRPQLGSADPGSTYVHIDRLEGVRVEGGALDEALLFTAQGAPTIRYHVRGPELGVWRSHTPRRTTTTPEVSPPTHEVALRYGLKALPLRQGPAATEPLLTRLKNGAKLQVLSEEEAPWWQVRAGGITGYVHSDHVRAIPPATQLQRGLTERLTTATE